MRAKRTRQASISEFFSDHAIGKELGLISNWLDERVAILDGVEADIQRKNRNATGRSGMTIEAILQAGFLLRYWQWTYADLGFHRMDSEVNRGFARFPCGLYPKASALQGVIRLIRAETWDRSTRSLKALKSSESTAPRRTARFMRHGTAAC